MSHFSVVVAISGDVPFADVEAAVEAALQPFHEFECTGTSDRYVLDVDITQKARDEHDADDGDFAEWVNGYYGLETLAPGDAPDKEGAHKYGWVRVDASGSVVEVIDRTNPNKKWDWWKVGGRWAGFFRARPSATAARGVDGLMGSNKSARGVDVLRKRDVDYAAEAAEVTAEAGAYHDRVHAVVDPHLEGFRTWDAVRKSIEGIDAARDAYHAQPAHKALVEAAKTDRELAWVELDELLCSRDEYIAKRVQSARTPFAFVDKSGQWHERGRMGWWACVSDEKHDWPAEFERELANVNDGDWLVAVDCHI